MRFYFNFNWHSLQSIRQFTFEWLNVRVTSKILKSNSYKIPHQLFHIKCGLLKKISVLCLNGAQGKHFKLITKLNLAPLK